MKSQGFGGKAELGAVFPSGIGLFFPLHPGMRNPGNEHRGCAAKPLLKAPGAWGDAKRLQNWGFLRWFWGCSKRDKEEIRIPGGSGAPEQIQRSKHDKKWPPGFIKML